jgi:hypothetical protein
MIGLGKGDAWEPAAGTTARVGFGVCKTGRGAKRRGPQASLRAGRSWASRRHAVAPEATTAREAGGGAGRGVGARGGARGRGERWDAGRGGHRAQKKGGVAARVPDSSLSARPLGHALS